AIGLKDRLLARLFARYQRALRDRGLADPAASEARAAAVLRDDPTHPVFQARFLFVDGLADFTSAQLTLLDALRRKAAAAWLALIEAPCVAGEVRLVARRVKELLLAGEAPCDILLAARDLGPYADLLREACAEYGIPLELEGDDPLTRCPAVALLLRA